MKTSRGASIGHTIAAGLALVFLAIGSIGPWITLGVLSRNGLDGGNDGWITLGLSAGAAVGVWGYFTRPRRAQGWWLAVDGVIAMVVGISDISDVQSRHATVFGINLSPSPGWGLYLVVGAGLVIALVGVSIARTTPRRAAPVPSASEDDVVIVHPEDSEPYPDEVPSA